MPVTLDSGYVISNNVTIVKCKCVEVSDVYINCEPIPFNKGFYSVDITYTFNVTLDTYVTASTTPTVVEGTAVFTKKVILFGSEGNTKTFTNTGETSGTTNESCDIVNLPKVTVQVVEPIVLESKLISRCCCDSANSSGLDGCNQSMRTFVVITLGLFSIVQISRPVALLVPVYDYCIPHKECTTSTDSPCEMFEKIKFPTDEFFPPALEDEGNGSSVQS